MSLFYRALEFVNRPAVQEEEGQALVEYGLILALVSIAAIVAMGLLGDQLIAIFHQVTGALGGPTA